MEQSMKTRRTQAILSALVLLLPPASCLAGRTGRPGGLVRRHEWQRSEIPGTKDKPFATLRRAQVAVRAAIRKGLKEDITVLIRGGTYF